MKKLYVISSACIVMLIASCKSGNEQQQQSAEEQTKTEVTKAAEASGIGESESYTMSDTVAWQGKIYNYNILMKANTKSDTIKNETGKMYFDNIAEVEITRRDGSVFFSHTFDKGDFAQYLPEKLKRYGILEGVVFEKAESGYLQLAVSVALPQSDDYQSLVVRISTSGGMSIEKVNRALEE